MKVKDGRGQNALMKARKNRADVKEWFDKNKNSTAIDCSRNTGIGYRTVLNHIKAIQKGSI